MDFRLPVGRCPTIFAQRSANLYKIDDVLNLKAVKEDMTPFPICTIYIQSDVMYMCGVVLLSQEIYILAEK